MTIDELIVAIKNRKGTESYHADFNDAIDAACRIIDQNRESLESGMRRALRFKKFSSGPMSFWVWVDNNGKSVRGKYHQDWLIAYQTKENVINHLDKLGLAAEFIDNKEDPDATGQENT